MLLCHLGRIHKCPRHSATANFFVAVMRGYAKDVETAICGFQYRFGLHLSAYSSRSPVLNIDGRAYADLSRTGKRLQGKECGLLHEANHVRSRINGWQRRVVMVKRVLVLNGLFN